MLAVLRPREGGLRPGEIFLAPPYYGQRAVFASPLSDFSLSSRLIIMHSLVAVCKLCMSVGMELPKTLEHTGAPSLGIGRG